MGTRRGVGNTTKQLLDRVPRVAGVGFVKLLSHDDIHSPIDTRAQRGSTKCGTTATVICGLHMLNTHGVSKHAWRCHRALAGVDMPRTRPQNLKAHAAQHTGPLC